MSRALYKNLIYLFTYTLIANFLTSFLVAQEVPLLDIPLDPSGTPYRIDSLYGIRVGGFHHGIDLNQRGTGPGHPLPSNTDLNHPILAETAGTIFGIGRTSTGGLKWIGINYGQNRTFAYLHIFPNDDPEVQTNFTKEITEGQGTGMITINHVRRVERNNDRNEGILLFYSHIDPHVLHQGRIVKTLYRNIQVFTVPGNDDELTGVAEPTQSPDAIVIRPGPDGVLETMPRGDDGIIALANEQFAISAGPNLMRDSAPGEVECQNTVVEADVIAPLGKSGADNPHLHLQISNPDEALVNTKDQNTTGNDGRDNIMFYLNHDSSRFEVRLVVPSSDPRNEEVLFHTADHDSERVLIDIDQVPAGTNTETFTGYDLDRIRIFAIPWNETVTEDNLVSDFINSVSPNFAINENRNPTGPNIEFDRPALPTADYFRAEFNYGGRGSPTNEDAFPGYINTTNNRGISEGETGPSTGIRPRLFPDPGTTRFIFNQWNTKIKTDFSTAALINIDARYPDGRWRIIPYAENVFRVDESAAHDSLNRSVTIDNFRPFAKQVAVTAPNENIYVAEWVFDPANGMYAIEPNTLESYLGRNVDITVTVIFNEPIAYEDTDRNLQSFIKMSDDTLKLDPLGPNLGAPAMRPLQPPEFISQIPLDLNAIQATFRFTIPEASKNDFYGDAAIVVDVRDLGKGLAPDVPDERGNKLLFIADQTNSFNPVDHLHRDAMGNLRGNDDPNNPGQKLPLDLQRDTYHKIQIDPVEPVAMIIDNTKHQPELAPQSKTIETANLSRARSK